MDTVTSQHRSPGILRSGTSWPTAETKLPPTPGDRWSNTPRDATAIPEYPGLRDCTHHPTFQRGPSVPPRRRYARFRDASNCWLVTPASTISVMQSRIPLRPAACPPGNSICPGGRPFGRRHPACNPHPPSPTVEKEQHLWRSCWQSTASNIASLCVSKEPSRCPR